MKNDKFTWTKIRRAYTTSAVKANALAWCIFAKTAHPMSTTGRMICALLGLIACLGQARAQACASLDLTYLSEIPSVCAEVTMTSILDAQDRPYLYVAKKDGGLAIYDLTVLAGPHLSSRVTIDKLNGLHVMNLVQEGNYLYLALGNSFGTTAWQSPGMAIVDISDPRQPVVTDVYEYPFEQGGGGIVRVQGTYAYLGAMTHGVVILDVSDKTDIRYVSEIQPDRSFPVANPDTVKYNARGMQVVGDRLYLAFDAGGFRVIDISNKLQPIEIGRYSNPVLNALPRAYNNVVVRDSLAYVTVDYCGMEVLDIRDPVKIRQVSWWNPDQCQTNPLKWFASPVHTNELALDTNCQVLFVATGKSDMMVIDITDPTALFACDSFGSVDNKMGTWGVSASDGKVFLSYVCTFGIPFESNWTGIKILRYQPCAASVEADPIVGWNSKEGVLKIPAQPHADVTCINTLGQTVYPSVTRGLASVEINFKDLPSGMYVVTARINNQVVHYKVIR